MICRWTACELPAKWQVPVNCRLAACELHGACSITERMFRDGALWHGNALLPQGTVRSVIEEYLIERTNMRASRRTHAGPARSHQPEGRKASRLSCIEVNRAAAGRDARRATQDDVMRRTPTNAASCWPPTRH